LSGQRAGRSIAQDGTGQEAAAADGSLGRPGWVGERLYTQECVRLGGSLLLWQRCREG